MSDDEYTKAIALVYVQQQMLNEKPNPDIYIVFKEGYGSSDIEAIFFSKEEAVELLNSRYKDWRPSKITICNRRRKGLSSVYYRKFSLPCFIDHYSDSDDEE